MDTELILFDLSMTSIEVDIVQVLYAYKVIKLDELSDLIGLSGVQLDTAIENVNKRLSIFSMELKVARGLVVLVNLSGDTLLGNSYTQLDLVFFRSLLEFILNNNYSINSNDALNTPSTLSKLHIEYLLDKFVESDWLVKSGNDLCIGIRSIVELSSLLDDLVDHDLYKSHFDGLLVTEGFYCKHCNTAITHSQSIQYNPSSCPNLQCKKPWKPRKIEINTKWSNIPSLTKNQFRMFIVRLIRQTPPARANDRYQETLRNLFTQLSTSLESQLHQLKVPPPPNSLRSTQARKFKPGWLFTTDSTVDLQSVANSLESRLRPLEDGVDKLKHQLGVHNRELERREHRLQQYTRTVNSLTEELDSVEATRMHPQLKRAFDHDEEDDNYSHNNAHRKSRRHLLSSAEETIYQHAQRQHLQPIYDIRHPHSTNNKDNDNDEKNSHTYSKEDDDYLHAALAPLLPRLQVLENTAIANNDPLLVAAEMRDIMESFYTSRRKYNDPEAFDWFDEPPLEVYEPHQQSPLSDAQHVHSPVSDVSTDDDFIAEFNRVQPQDSDSDSNSDNDSNDSHSPDSDVIASSDYSSHKGSPPPKRSRSVIPLGPDLSPRGSVSGSNDSESESESSNHLQPQSHTHTNPLQSP
ncbi:hypothetical protein E3P84_03231 [Wallemia ichthyophaga]|nr:hypothetical protein E3P91_02839 [Wallemia ichthyophaga]TIA97417.1 hypothetical protein E3P95_02862 [Wallemia ichthyophaga]TIA99874.1 hypothetical protein E3P94_02405 [Wallemia ichthyophaga]TIB30694.1 hypothetical protein E3P84_03231 [Wallemia ichthyophaga]TIB40001.1 hypothetical protein E3P83_03174 [Wallemia ichthyophaga]